MKKTILLLLSLASLVPSATARQPQRGYRGFVDLVSNIRSQNVGILDINGNIDVYREIAVYSGISTSHGYQINPVFFVGAGIGMELCGDNTGVVPLFAHGRADLKFGRFTPFGDIRLGTNLAEGGGIYFSPSVGYRFNWGRKVGINVGLGMTLAGYKSHHYEGTYIAPDSYEFHYVGIKRHLNTCFTVRAGLDF